MRELIAAIAGLGVLLYIMRNEKAPVPLTRNVIEGFEPEILQNTLNLIQEREPNVYPIETVYFQKGESAGGGYIGRFMFLNTDGFFGVQYDVETDGKTLFSLNKSVPPDAQSPFKGYVARQKYGDILNIKAPEINMAKIHDNLKSENMVGYYDKKSVSV
jgi:hypothetical protein